MRAGYFMAHPSISSRSRISLSLIGEHKVEACLVIVITEGGLHDLVGRGDAGTTTDEANVVNLVLDLADLEVTASVVLDMTSRAFRFHRIANLERFEVLAHFAAVREARVHVGEVDLDDEVEVALLVVVRGRGVRT